MVPQQIPPLDFPGQNNLCCIWTTGTGNHAKPTKQAISISIVKWKYWPKQPQVEAILPKANHLFMNVYYKNFHYILSGNNCSISLKDVFFLFISHKSSLSIFEITMDSKLSCWRWGTQSRPINKEVNYDEWVDAWSVTFPKSFLIQYLAQIQYTRYVTFYPNLHNPVNFIPFGMIIHFFDINLINIHKHNLHMTCLLVFFVCF